MKVAFLFPGSGPYEAIDNWILTMAMYTRHDVRLMRSAEECIGGFFDCVFLVTEGRTYPRERINTDMATLRRSQVKFGVVHNHDNPGVPMPDEYPSFVWTKRGQERLAQYQPMLFRQPIFPAVQGVATTTTPVIGTFGHIEAKKCTFEMARWAKKHSIQFIAAGPDVYSKEQELYIKDVANTCTVRTYPWFEHVAKVSYLIRDCTHLMFVLIESKRGTGGSPTSPRFAGFFNRPIIVVDDEDTFAEDGYYVFSRLAEIDPTGLPAMKPPLYHWSPDVYLDRLCMETLDYWNEK